MPVLKMTASARALQRCVARAYVVTARVVMALYIPAAEDVDGDGHVLRRRLSAVAASAIAARADADASARLVLDRPSAVLIGALYS